MIVYVYFIAVAIGIRFISDKRLRLYGLLCSLIIAYISYHIVVPEASDLFRHLQEIDYYRDYGWRWYVVANRSAENVGAAIVYYLASFLPDNKWFPALVSFLSYGLLYDLIIKVYNDNENSRKWLSGAILFVGLSFNYYLLIFAVRMWVVFIVFAYCMYTELVRKKHRVICWLVYAFLVLFHYAAIILVVFRIVIMILHRTEGNNEIIKKMAIIIVSIVGIYFVLNSPLGSTIMRKVDGYTGYAVRGTWQTISCWGRSIGIGLLALYQLKREERGEYRAYYGFLICVLLLMISQFRNYQITLRFADCLIVSSVPVLPQIVNRNGRDVFIVSYPQLFAIIVMIISVAYTLLFDYRLLAFVF